MYTNFIHEQIIRLENTDWIEKKINHKIERARIAEMEAKYTSMPSFINGMRNPYKTALYHEMENALKALDMKLKCESLKL